MSTHIDIPDNVMCNEASESPNLEMPVEDKKRPAEEVAGSIEDSERMAKQPRIDQDAPASTATEDTDSMDANEKQPQPEPGPKPDADPVAVPTSADIVTDAPKPLNNRLVNTETNVKIPRRKQVILLGYNGTGYVGMQKNPDVRTIEDEILEALLKCDLIREIDHEKQQECQFQRTARTDKGVHAARQVVSLKMGYGVPDVVSKLNNVLPEQIRVFAVTKVTKPFNCKQQCTGRRYQYLAPTYSFSPKGTPTEKSLEFRADADLIEKINSVLKEFIGTHNFHNFTSKRSADDMSSQRYIRQFYCSQPYITNGIEFVMITVEGQSFVLHQIRKMIGFTMAIVRGYTTIESLRKAFKHAKMDVPKAPGLGLLLDKCFFDNYDKKFAKDKEHETLGWQELDPIVEDFKKKYIFSEMAETEKTEKVILSWLDSLDAHDYSTTEAEVFAVQHEKVKTATTVSTTTTTTTTTGTTDEATTTAEERALAKEKANKKEYAKSRFGGKRQRPRGPKGVCFDFLKGNCVRGDRCRFSHDITKGVIRDGEDDNTNTDADNTKNNTPNNNSNTNSAANEKRLNVCYDFMIGCCNRPNCRYPHIKKSKTKSNQCDAVKNDNNDNSKDGDKNNYNNTNNNNNNNNNNSDNTTTNNNISAVPVNNIDTTTTKTPLSATTTAATTATTTAATLTTTTAATPTATPTTAATTTTASRVEKAPTTITTVATATTTATPT